MNIIPPCAYEGCQNISSGICEGSQKSICFLKNEREKYSLFDNDCGKYFCQDHLKSRWGSVTCTYHHKENRCVIL